MKLCKLYTEEVINNHNSTSTTKESSLDTKNVKIDPEEEQDVQIIITNVKLEDSNTPIKRETDTTYFGSDADDDDSFEADENHYHSTDNNYDNNLLLVELKPISEIKTQLPSDTKKNKCTECSKTFSNQSNMVRHVRVVHQHDKRYICDICKIAYADIGTIRKHMITHTHIYGCNICDRTFKTESRLKTHKIKHLPPDERILEKRIQKKKYKYKFEGICQYCGKFFSHRGSFSEHKRTHTGERPYECDICHKRFALPKTLKFHYHIHTGEKSFQCDLCGLKFRQRMLLKVHKVNHHTEGARPHQCEYCHKSFAMRGTLNAHTRIHTGETKYECQECGAKFIDLTQLKRHKKKHEVSSNALNALKVETKKIKIQKESISDVSGTNIEKKVK